MKEGVPPGSETETQGRFFGIAFEGELKFI